jgi:uncharacterized damage-inducible protein DinB
MDVHSHLLRQFAYDDWANREVISGLLALPQPPQKAVRLMAHLVAAELVWLARLRGEVDPAVWPEWDITSVEAKQREIALKLAEYLRSRMPEDLAREVEYKNTKGERWKNSIADILNHVAMHSAYHRGQIAMAMRDAGFTPAYTDYIQAVRTGRVAE